MTATSFLSTCSNDTTVPAVTDPTPVAVLALFHEVVDAVAATLARQSDWGASGGRIGQYAVDLVTDAACTGLLLGAGFAVLSEESGLDGPDGVPIVVVDPLDGSTNASRGIPWYATSLCAVDAEGPLAALVVNQASGRAYEAVRGGGARVAGRACTPSGATDLGRSIIGLSGYPHQYLGWKQYRALGAAALDLCAVAEGVLDGYVDCSPSAHGSWDYAAGLLVCREAGVEVVDAFDRDLLDPEALRHADRRTPVAGATAALTAELVEARRRLRWPDDPDLADLAPTDRR
jgi:myo-inositol-1(or 4)-monophosphatase